MEKNWKKREWQKTSWARGGNDYNNNQLDRVMTRKTNRLALEGGEKPWLKVGKEFSFLEKLCRVER